MLEEDPMGWGYCAMQDLYTFVRHNECACDMFKVKGEEDND